MFGIRNLIIQSCRKSSTARLELVGQLRKELAGIKDAGTYKSERIITGPQGMEINIAGSDKKLLNFCSNNYLGLSSHPDVIAAGKAATDSHGAGMSSVRFICGTQDIHRKLEKKIAKFHGRDDAILYASCFDANAGIFEVLAGKEDAIISDELNHASIIDGIRLSKAKRFLYKHLNLQNLEDHLKAAQDCRRRIIVTDGAFSMDGDVAPLPEITHLAKKYNALLFVDECHATGFLGSTGRGTEELYGLNNQIDIINSTLGKALGGTMGGYTTGPQELIDLLRQRSRPYLFSNSLAPNLVGSSLQVFTMLLENNTFVQSMNSNVERFRTQMKSAGFNVLGNPQHPICPVLLGDARLASQFADALLEKGIYVIGFSFPVVPRGQARIRVIVSAAHSHEQIDRCVEAFTTIGKKLSII